MRVSSEAARLAKSPCIPFVGLDLLIAGGVHRGEVRIRHDYFVPELFEVTGDPLALGRGLDEDARRRPGSEYLIEARPGALDAALG